MFEETLNDLSLNLHLEMLITWCLRIIGAILILVLGWLIGNWVSSRIARFHRIDVTLGHFLSNVARYIIMAVAIVAVLSQFGIQTASLLAVLGAAGLAIGLALQGTLSNVAAGTMLLILRPFKIDDLVQIAGIKGTVKDLGLFGTEIATLDNVFIFVPNSKIWDQEIWNITRNPYRRLDLRVGIGYGDDITKAKQLVSDVLDACNETITNDDGMKPQILVESLGDSSVNLWIRVWCKRQDYLPAQSMAYQMIKESFDAHGISIPFPTRTVEYVGRPTGLSAG